MKLKKMSQKQEKSVAEEFNAKTVVASGAMWGSKGDVRNDKYLIECKMTQKPFYSLTKSTWEKIEKEAIKDGLRIPMMCIDVEGCKYQFIVMLKKDLPEDILERQSKRRDIITYTDVVPQKSFRVQNKGCDIYYYQTDWGEFAVMKRHDFSEYM